MHVTKFRSSIINLKNKKYIPNDKTIKIEFKQRLHKFTSDYIVVINRKNIYYINAKNKINKK